MRKLTLDQAIQLHLKELKKPYKVLAAKTTSATSFWVKFQTEEYTTEQYVGLLGTERFVAGFEEISEKERE